MGWPNLGGMVNASTFLKSTHLVPSLSMVLMKPDVSSRQNWNFQKFLNISKFFACSKRSNEPICVQKIIPKFRILEHNENSVDFCLIVTKTTYFKNADEGHLVIFFLEVFTLPVLLPPIYLWGFYYIYNK